MIHTPILKLDAATPDAEAMRQASSALIAGQVLIIPTDTVYGIALLASDTANIDRLFQSKQRPVDKSIPLLVGSTNDLMRFGRDIPDYAKELAAQNWPGALTLVVRASDEVPKQFVAVDGSIALRMPGPSIALALLEATGALIACSSANLSGRSPALCTDELDPELAANADLIIDGGSLSGGRASTVVSCLEAEPHVLRPGPILL